MSKIKNGTTIVQGNLPDGSIDVNIQDVTSAPVADYFLQSLSNFSLSVDTPVSTDTTLIYSFSATGGHGITVGNEIILLDVVGDRSIIGIVTNVATNVITIDRPIDHIFPSASTLGRIVSSDMRVNGSVTPVIFTMRAGATPVDIINIEINITDSDKGDDSTFGKTANGPLTNGLVLRIVDGYQKTVFNFKNNGDFSQFGADFSYNEKGKQPNTYGYHAHINLKEILGTVFRVSGDSILQLIVQDDLTSMVGSIAVTGLGQETVGE